MAKDLRASAEDTPEEDVMMAKDAVLLKSESIPKGIRQVAGINFDDFDGSDVKVCDLVDAMAGMGFQASSIADAVNTINQMVRQKDFIPLWHFG